MLILTIRTDNPEAEIGLYDDASQLVYETWTAHRQLAETLHSKIQELLQAQHTTIHDMQAVACYAGPGSFTGLRIGLTVANTLAYALQSQVVAASGDDWLTRAIERLMNGESDPLAIPEYGADVHITLPKA